MTYAQQMSKTTKSDMGNKPQLIIAILFIIALSVLAKAEVIRTTIDLTDSILIETKTTTFIGACMFLDGEYNVLNNTCTIECAFDNEKDSK